MVLAKRTGAPANLQNPASRRIKRRNDTAVLHHVVHAFVKQRRRDVRNILLKPPTNRARFELTPRVARANGYHPPVTHAQRARDIPFFGVNVPVVVVINPAEVLSIVWIGAKLLL